MILAYSSTHVLSSFLLIIFGWEDSDDDDQNAGKMSKKKQRAMLPRQWLDLDGLVDLCHGRCRIACQLQS